MALDEAVGDLPREPGVYVFEDADGAVIYVGKAADLRDRVASYRNPDSQKTRRLVRRIDDVDVIVTDNETEALALEANLIKRHRPRYNVRFADDKRYPYIKFTDDDFPRIEVTRRVQGDGARYFGPYPHVGAARRTMRIVRQLFEIRDCKEMRPTGCLSYHIDMCTAPCMDYVDEDGYADQVDRAARFLRGGGRELVDELRDRMEALSDELAFEEAARVRDQVQALERTLSRQNVHTPELKDRDVVGVDVRDDRAFVALLFVRKGRVVKKETFELEGQADVGEVLTTFLTQYYATSLHVPGEVVVPDEPRDREQLEGVLADARGGPVDVTVPGSGSRAKQVAMARDNAEHEAKLQLKKDARRKGLSERMAALGEAFDLPETPSTVAAVDVSHHAGREVAGARVWFTDGEPDKERYRHLHLDDGGDDPAGIAEVVARTLDRDVEAGAPPDVLLVDGGRDQVQAARRVVEDRDVDPLLVGLAKDDELLYLPDGSVLDFGEDDPALQVLMHARDEAHRFANRLRTSKTDAGASVLEDVDGVGTVRARRLLREFGGVDGLSEAGVGAVAAVDGIGPELAERIVDALERSG